MTNNKNPDWFGKVRWIQGRTGYGTLTCRRALIASRGDLDEAMKWLREFERENLRDASVRAVLEAQRKAKAKEKE
jgi:translation elongation factor EF-Ts